MGTAAKQPIWRGHRKTIGVKVAALCLCLSFATGTAAQAQTTDRGQPALPADELALGPDVQRTVGAPAGPPVKGDELRRRTDDLSSRMRCPVCQGHAVVDSPAEAARNMKRQVRAMIAAGYSEDQIFRYFETRYGEFIRLVPRAEGFNLLVWVIPLIGLLGGLAVVVTMFRRRRTDARSPAPGSDAPADHCAAQPKVIAENATEATEEDIADGLGDETSRLDPWIKKVREQISDPDK